MLTCRDISVGYSRERVILRNLSLDISPGQITALLGPNGCGKTTLLRVLLGGLVPVSGSVELLGCPLAEITIPKRARHIAYAPQNPSPAPGYSALEVLNFAGTSAALASSDPLAEHRGTVIDALELGPLLALPFDHLSAGQRQRISLGRAILQLLASPEPAAHKVLLADEPGSAMDPQHLLRAESCLTSLARQGYAILVVLHDLLAASRIVDAAILLDSGGTLRASGPAADILTPDILSQVFQARFQATAQGPMLLRA